MAWDKALPSGSKAASLLDDDVRTNNDWLEETLSAEHVFPGTTITRGRHTVPSGSTATMSAITTPSAGNLFLNDNGYLYKYVAAPTNDWVPVVGVDEPRMFSGDVGSLPYGFQLCDGTNSTPDLESQFIVGYDAADADYNAIGNTGGAKEITLSEAETPLKTHDHPGSTFSGTSGSTDLAHIHNTNIDEFNSEAGGGEHSNDDGDAGSPINTGAASVSMIHNHSLSGSVTVASENDTGTAHENRPQFYTLAFIIVSP